MNRSNPTGIPDHLLLHLRWGAVLILAFVLTACNEQSNEPASTDSHAPGTAENPAAASRTATVTEARIIAADDEPGNWLSHGRTYDEQRFSPLKQINRENVGSLGLAWETSAGSVRGLEATPVIVDGVMYTTSTWSRVMALDAKTGKLRDGAGCENRQIAVGVQPESTTFMGQETLL